MKRMLKACILKLIVRDRFLNECGLKFIPMDIALSLYCKVELYWMFRCVQLLLDWVRLTCHIEMRLSCPRNEDDDDPALKFFLFCMS